MSIKVGFKSERLQRLCEDHKGLCRQYGKLQADKIMLRITQINAAENLYDLSMLPQTGLHPLAGDRKGSFAVHLKHPYRMIFVPLNGDISDWKSITEIKIIDPCTDYH